MMRLRLVLSVLAVALLSSCSSREQRLACLERRIAFDRSQPEHAAVSRLFSDTLSAWAAIGLGYARGHLSDLWVIDPIVFDRRRNRALIFMLSVDTSSGAQLDIVTMFAAERTRGKWLFYMGGPLPTIYYRREQNPGRVPFTFDQLASYVRIQLDNAGYVTYDACEANDEVVNYYFTEHIYRNQLQLWERLGQ